jgi:hypothetical protein
MGRILDIFQESEKIEQVSTVFNMCITHGKIDSNINRRNSIKTPSSPTASDLIPRIASKTSSQEYWKKKIVYHGHNRQVWPEVPLAMGPYVRHLPLTMSSNYSARQTKNFQLTHLSSYSKLIILLCVSYGYHDLDDLKNLLT